MRKIINLVKSDFLSYLLIIVIGLLAGRWLLQPGYFNMHDDLQMMRQLAMHECFRDLQIPCRWTPHMGYGFGFPLFNYYPPLPYLVGEVIKVLGFSFVDTVKATFLLSFLISGLTMYILSREFWGRAGGFLSAVFYIWAPYHSVDIFVRGAMNEAWALCWFPLALWSGYKFIKDKKFSFFLTVVLSWAALLLSHNLMAMIFTPLFGIWCLFWFWKLNKWKQAPQLTLAGLWSIGLAAFFTIPVFLEQKFVHVETLVQGYYEYVAHFANTYQILFSRFWGYGPSAWLTDGDRMSFQIGHLHWIVSIILIFLVVFRIWRKKKIQTLDYIILFFAAAGWFASFMVHSRSTPIWQTFDKFLKFVQFPWRFLTLSILCFSFISGATVIFLEKGKGLIKFLIVFTLSACIIIWNWHYFEPEYGKMGPLTDREKFSAAAWDLQQTAGIYDYLPNGAKTAPKEAQKSVGEILEGGGEVYDMIQTSNFAEFKVNIISEQAKIRIGIFEYPGWKVFLDGNEASIYIGDDDWGRMHIDAPKGEHTITAKLINTPARTAGNAISLVSWAALLTIPVLRKKIKRGF